MTQSSPILCHTEAGFIFYWLDVQQLFSFFVGIVGICIAPCCIKLVYLEAFLALCTELSNIEADIYILQTNLQLS